MIYEYCYCYGYDYGDDYDYDCDYDNGKMGDARSERFHFLLTPLTTRTFTIKCRLSGSEAEAEEYTITMLIPTLCDWFSRPSTPICDFEYLVFT